MVERWIPNPLVAGSIPAAPAKTMAPLNLSGAFCVSDPSMKPWVMYDMVNRRVGPENHLLHVLTHKYAP